MTTATTHPEFNPGRSPLFAVAAVFATALTIGVAVLLPGNPRSRRAWPPSPRHNPRSMRSSPSRPRSWRFKLTQLVTLPPVEVVGTRPTKSAANRWSVPAVYKQKS